MSDLEWCRFPEPEALRLFRSLLELRLRHLGCPAEILKVEKRISLDEERFLVMFRFGAVRHAVVSAYTADLLADVEAFADMTTGWCDGREGATVKKEELVERLQEIIQRLEDSCGNNGCQIKAPTGMATNGPCRCGPYHVGRELKELGELVRRPGPWGKEGS